jgi:hypothetical protein
MQRVVRLLEADDSRPPPEPSERRGERDALVVRELVRRIRPSS